MNILQNTQEINKCFITFGGSKGSSQQVDVFSVQLTLAIGQFPSCIVTISEASNTYPKIDQQCRLYLRVDNTDKVLFDGYIAEEVQSINASPQSIQGYRQYRIAIMTEAIDSIPPTGITYLTNAVNAENAVVQGFVLVGNNIGTGTQTVKGQQALSTNIANIIRSTVNELQRATLNSQHNNEIQNLLSTSNCFLNVRGQVSCVDYIADRASALIRQGASYINTIQTLCNEFYLSLVPKLMKKNPDSFRMRIEYVPAWGPAPVDTLKLSDYQDITSSVSSQRNRQIDGIIMPYWDTTGANPTHIGNYAFYGQKTNSSGATFSIINKQTLMAYTQTNTTGLRYQQVSIPSWLAKGLSTGILQQAVKGIVKTYFALHAYANRVIQLTIPFHKYWELRSKLGDLIQVEAFTDSIEKNTQKSSNTNKSIISNTLSRFHQKHKDNFNKFHKNTQGNRNTTCYIGQLSSITLSLNFIQSKMVLHCSANISHVRPDTLNNKVKLRNNDFIYQL